MIKNFFSSLFKKDQTIFLYLDDFAYKVRDIALEKIDNNKPISGEVMFLEGYNNYKDLNNYVESKFVHIANKFMSDIPEINTLEDMKIYYRDCLIHNCVLNEDGLMVDGNKRDYYINFIKNFKVIKKCSYDKV